MGGTGVELRMKILRESAEQQILKPLQTHGWVAEIESESTAGEYLIVAANKSETTKKVALMYSSGTSNDHYKALDAIVDHIFTNGALYRIEQFAYGIETPVEPVDDFFPLLVSWNKALAPPEPSLVQDSKPRPQKQRIITSENPLDGVWMHLKQFASSQNAKNLVARRAEQEGVPLESPVLTSKAEGVAFTIRNAVDYLREPSAKALNGRILRLYYGTLALAFAEMLASPRGPGDLDEVEGFTKFGHGLYTLSGSGDFGSLRVGALASGFFPRWVSFIGHDVTLNLPPFSGHPKTRNNARGVIHVREEKRAPTAAQVYA